jgi:pimeloyl-ACP methyl ester carboxylesterase
MERTKIDGLELAHDVRGAGDPVVLIHWGVSAWWAEPLWHEPALAEHFQLITYHRAGFGGSGRAEDGISIADHAEHCRLLMDRLGVERAHLVGHSSSAAVVLQLALDAPDVAHTLTLLDAARPMPDTQTQQAFTRDVVVPAVQSYRAGNSAAAVDMWCRGVFGDGYRARRGVAEVLDDALAHADAFFTQELPALQRWRFTEQEARRVHAPVLAVVGEHSAPTFPERRELLSRWLPTVEQLDLPDATHLLHLENPRGAAEAMADYFTRHPIATADRVATQPRSR